MSIRKAAVAGSFYPSDPAELEHEVNFFLERGKEWVNEKKLTADAEKITGILVPHAGYVFSGEVAASAYGFIQNQEYDTVVVIGPSHREAISFNSVQVEGAYSTPLGDVEIDSDFAAKLTEMNENIRVDERGHQTSDRPSWQGPSGEHSIEVQLPFLQVVLGRQFKFVPIVMGVQTKTAAEGLAKTLAELAVDKKVLFVASCDLSHFKGYDEAGRMDGRLVEAVDENDIDDLWYTINSGKSEACGVGPLSAVMKVCRFLGATESKVIRYANSGDVPHGEKKRVVGYLSSIFMKP